MTDAARELAAQLADRGAPLVHTAAGFPHVVDKLAAAWDDPERLREVFDELLIDRRGGRQGFPAQVLQELLALYARCQHRLPRRRECPWDQA
jgi:tankyrase